MPPDDQGTNQGQNQGDQSAEALQAKAKADADAAAAAAAAGNKPARPEGLDDAFWDPDKGVKLNELVQTLGSLKAFKAEADVRAQGVPKDPKEYVVDLSGMKDSTGKPILDKDGQPLKMDENHPLLAPFRAWAQKNGVTKEAFNELAMAEVQRQLKEDADFNAAIVAEKTKLGTDADKRIDAVKTALTARLGDKAGALLKYTVSADAVEALEKLLRTTSAPAYDGGGGSGEQKPDYSKMTIEERLEYARRQQNKAA